jgi:hypothetical protein
VIVRQTESERRASQAIEASKKQEARSKKQPPLIAFICPRGNGENESFSLITRTQACPGHSALAVRDDITVIHFLKMVSGLVS